jgi:hypothetical protein
MLRTNCTHAELARFEKNAVCQLNTILIVHKHYSLIFLHKNWKLLTFCHFCKITIHKKHNTCIVQKQATMVVATRASNNQTISTLLKKSKKGTR